MKVPPDSLLARKYLENRDRGPGYFHALKNAPLRMGAGLILAVVAALFYIFSRMDGFLFAAGLGLGGFLRDLGWFTSIRRTWPFVERITDWRKVEELAGGEKSGIIREHP